MSTSGCIKVVGHMRNGAEIIIVRGRQSGKRLVRRESTRLQQHGYSTVKAVYSSPFDVLFCSNAELLLPKLEDTGVMHDSSVR